MTLIDKAEALLPCPFCGSTMQVAMRDAMLCLECYAAGPQDEDRKTAWNRRALPARGVGVKDARDALEELANMPLGIPLEDWARLSARILAALAPTDAAHVNETPKSEHDGADALTAAQARECCDLCGSDVTDMDGHLVHDEGCNGDTYAPAAQAREAALREAVKAGMRIAMETPIERVPAAVDAAILALIGEART